MKPFLASSIPAKKWYTDHSCICNLKFRVKELKYLIDTSYLLQRQIRYTIVNTYHKWQKVCNNDILKQQQTIEFRVVILMNALTSYVQANGLLRQKLYHHHHLYQSCRLNDINEGCTLNGLLWWAAGWTKLA